MATVQRVVAVTFTAPFARPHPNLPRLKPGPDWMRLLMLLAGSHSCSSKQHYSGTLSNRVGMMEVHNDRLPI